METQRKTAGVQHTSTFCFWSVADGPWAVMLANAIRTARRVGLETDFHVWSDADVPGALVHQSGPFSKKHYLFKFMYLQRAARLNYDYLVWIDSDTVFVRHPGCLLQLMEDSVLHIALETDLCHAKRCRDEWWNCPVDTYIRLMKEQGVTSDRIYNVNGGFWIVKRDFAVRVARMALSFWQHCFSAGVAVPDEFGLAFAMHMLCPDLSRHTLERTNNFWATDWNGHFAERVPDGEPWPLEEYFTGCLTTINPAIVHAMSSKSALHRKL